VRCATFMARAVLRATLAERAAAAADAAATAVTLALPMAVTKVEHLVHLSPSLFAELAPELPERMTGADFLAAYGTHDDDATRIEPHTIYELRACAAHPIHEHFRVGSFRALLNTASKDGATRSVNGATGTHDAAATAMAGCAVEEAVDPLLVMLGELMYQSHASYSAVGLGSQATDQLVQLVRSLGPASGLYGAKITGGGSGGTVCILGSNTASAEASLQRVLSAYERISSHVPYVFSGSSTGAVAFGHVVAELRGGATQLAGTHKKGAAAGGGQKRKGHD